MHDSAKSATTEAVSVGSEFFWPDCPRERLTPSKLNPREQFDKADLADLAQSMRTNGIIEPIIARPVGTGYEIVCGERRWRASADAGLATVPVIVKHLSAAQALELMVIENDQRKDVTALERAKGYTRLMEADPKFRDRKVLAERIGKSLSWVHAAMKLLDLVPAAQKALLAGAITEGHAVLMARLQPADQSRALYTVTLRERGQGIPGGTMISVRALKEWIARDVFMDLDKAPFPKDDAQLVVAAGACSACPKRAAANAALFEDAKHANTCTDRTCYESKVQAATLVRLATVSTPGAPAVLVTRTYYVDRDDRKKLPAPLLTSGDWKDAGKKSCPHTRPALLVDSQTLAVSTKSEGLVCTKPRDCKVHAETPERQETAADRAADTRRTVAERKRRVDQQVYREILLGVRQKVAPQLQEADLRVIASRFVHEMHSDRVRAVYGYMDWPAPTKSPGSFGLNFPKAAEKQLSTAGVDELARFLLVAALSAAAEVSLNPYYGQPDHKPLLEAAKRWKVDATGIEKRIRAETAAKFNALDARIKKSVQTSAPKSKPKKKR